MRIKLISGILLLLLIGASLEGCNGDYRAEAVGSNGEIVVVMDSTMWHSKTANAIRDVFGGYMPTVIRPEPRYDLHFQTLRSTSDLDRVKKSKNVIFAATLNENTNTGKFIRAILSKGIQQRVKEGKNFAFPVRNKWYRNQWTMFLTGNSDDSLAEKIERSSDQLLSSLHKVTLQRWNTYLYHRGEQKAIEDTLWNKFGFKMRIEHDYDFNVDTTHFVSMRWQMMTNDRWFWIWWKDNVYDVDNINQKWINAKRDSLNKRYVQGTRDSAYVTTVYNKDKAPIITKTLEMHGRYALRTMGWWQMTKGAMGGPFVNYTIYSPKQRRLYMIEFSQFAPKYRKRKFIRQFQAMAWTFQPDTTLTPEKIDKMDKKLYGGKK
ncbi:MAG TPA: DUF4837 family protein [Balneolales bacterium]|nr:DUF4837 family protein [Balneolales bacterium]